MLPVDLSEGFFGSAIQLELHHINEFICFQNEIDTPFSGMIFHLRIESH